MSDDEKLAAPSFESMDAGLRVRRGERGFDPGEVIPAPLEYRARADHAGRLRRRARRTAAPAPYTLNAAQLQVFTQQRRGGARADAPRRPGAVPQRSRRGRGDACTPERWIILPIGDGPAADGRPERAHLERVPAPR